MRDPKRIDEILERLAKVWKQYPDLRLSQLILNIDLDHDGPTDGWPRLFYMEDSELIEEIEKITNRIYYKGSKYKESEDDS